MELQRPVEVEDAEVWDGALRRLPEPHLLQSWHWGQVKSSQGWSPLRLLWRNGSDQPQAAAQVLERTASLPGLRLPVLYCPKGPILDWGQVELRRRVLSDLTDLGRRKAVIQLKIDADVPLGWGVPGEENDSPSREGAAVEADLIELGWRPSDEQIQFRNTMIVDLQPSEDEIMAAMKQKTRYNVRLADRRGVVVRRGDVEDIRLLYKMFAETSLRDGFAIRGQEYYRQAWGRFIRRDEARPLIAEVEGEAVAAVIPYRFGDRAWYLYGMSRDAHREKMPNYLLQWEAICWAKESGCTSYDLWGAPDRFDRSDPMYGVYRFKRGFPATVLRTMGAWDYPARRRLYSAYHFLLPKVLTLLRALGRRQTASSLD